MIRDHWKPILCKLLRRSIPYLPALAISGLLAHRAISEVFLKAGQPAVPLDDAFIHFQYAKNLAHGHFFTYSPGDGFTPGATSFLWPLLLAPFYLFGFRELSIIWIAWLFGFLAHAGLIVETYRLASKLTRPGPAYGAAAMTALFGGFTWFAASGMETVPLAWALARTARLASEWCEATDETRSTSLRNQLIIFGIICPLIRPEGALGSLFALAALALFPSPGVKAPWKRRLLSLIPLAGVLFVPFVNLIFTGHASSTTATVKLLLLNPYYPSVSILWPPIRDNIALLYQTLLNGEEWSAIFIPKHARPIAVASLMAIPICGWRSNRMHRSLFVLFFALGILGTCTYGSFLWNRLRYLWPFIPGWFIGTACLARLLSEVLASIRPAFIASAPAFSGMAAGAFAVSLPWTLDDLGKSAAAIDKQQVALGKWAAANLPSEAIIGVNDTGAIAYFSNRRTFDVVGLTTSDQAKYWVQGTGSRFEEYERIWATNPQRFPTHFIVYSAWMDCPAVLGPSIHEASVFDQSILGGTTMTVFPAKTALLGSGNRPFQFTLDSLLDELDISDLESEAAHHYDFVNGGGRETTNRAHIGYADDLSGKSHIPEDPEDPDEPEGKSSLRSWADGGRFQRTRDAFLVNLPQGQAVRAIARWQGQDSGPVDLSIKVNGSNLVTIKLPPSIDVEKAFLIPANLAGPKTRIEVSVLGMGNFGSMHYWFDKGKAD